MKVKINERQESFVQMIFWCGMWLVLLHMIVGCTFHVGFDYQGETSIDKRTFSQKEKK